MVKYRICEKCGDTFTAYKCEYTTIIECVDTADALIREQIIQHENCYYMKLDTIDNSIQIKKV